MIDDPGNLLSKIFIYLLAAVLAVPAARRLGFGPVLGFLLTGVLIGPWGLALISGPESIALFTQVSTVIVLLMVTLQATSDVWDGLFEDLLALGLAQIVASGLIIMIVALLIGHPWQHAVVSGLALSMSSSAIAGHEFQVRYPGGSTLTDSGRRLLLTQTLTLLPILILLPLLGFDAILDPKLVWPQVWLAVFVVGVLMLVGHVVLRYAFRVVAGFGLDEIFAAFALVLVIGILLLMQELGLSMALGAMVAGLLLTRSEYGSAIQLSIRPFAGLLVGLFFISVGMSIDFAVLVRKPAELLALVALLVVVKAWILRNLLRYSAVPRSQRTWLATVLSQSGELAFVVLYAALSVRAIPDSLASTLALVVTLSMLSTPLLLVFADRRNEMQSNSPGDSGVGPGESADAQAVVAGYGGMGVQIAALLARQEHRLSVIDHNPVRVEAARHDGFIGMYGDALRPDLLHTAGIQRAAVLVIAIDDAARTLELTRRMRLEHPRLNIVARAVDQAHCERLREAGADRAYRATFETALLMGEDALEMLGASPLEAQAWAEAYRDDEAAAVPAAQDAAQTPDYTAPAPETGPPRTR